MRIAVPVISEQVCMHFGHCDSFSFFDVDENDKKILTKEILTPPPHEPGVLPKWIAEQGTHLVLAGGMGQKAQSILQQKGVKVITGIMEKNPEKAVLDYLNERLLSGANACDH